MNHYSHSTCENMFYYMIKKKTKKNQSDRTWIHMAVDSILGQFRI
jgi:hypothetical protein